MNDEHPYEDRYDVLGKVGKVLFVVCTFKKENVVCIILARRQSPRKRGMSMAKVLLNIWGETKGEEHYHDVCIFLNKTTLQKHKTGKLNELVPSIRNKLYVVQSGGRGNMYLINEEVIK